MYIYIFLLVEKLCKLREIYYAMGYAKNFDMYLADSKFELPKMKKGGKAKYTPTMGVSVLERHFFRTQWGEYRKKNFGGRWGPNHTE